MWKDWSIRDYNASWEVSEAADRLHFLTPKGLDNKAGGRASRTPGTRPPQPILPPKGLHKLNEVSYATPFR